MSWIYLLLGILIYFGLSNCRPNGAPSESCFYMTPRHIHPHTFRKVFPTRAMGLYNITTSADIFRPDRPIRVTLWGPPFKGFMLVAAEEGAKDWPTGIFYSDDGAAKRISCLSRGDTVTHQNNSYKDSVSVLWYGPENMMSEQIQFIATVVVNLTIYYTNIKSGFIRLDPTLHAAGGGGGENGPLPVTMDPWLSGQSATPAPTNWWGGGRGGGGAGVAGAGRNGILNSLGSLLGLGGGTAGGGSSWGSGSSAGGTWYGSGSGSGASGGGSNTWSSGSDWQQYGDGSATSRSTWGGAGGSSWSQQSGNTWGSGSGSSWGGSQGGSSNSWGSSQGGSDSWGSSGGTWGSGGSAVPSSGSGTSAPAVVPQPSAGGASIWTWGSGPSTQAPVVRTTKAPTPAPAQSPAASAWSVDNLINLLKQLKPTGTQGAKASV